MIIDDPEEMVVVKRALAEYAVNIRAAVRAPDDDKDIAGFTRWRLAHMSAARAEQMLQRQGMRDVIAEAPKS